MCRFVLDGEVTTERSIRRHRGEAAPRGNEADTASDIDAEVSGVEDDPVDNIDELDSDIDVDTEEVTDDEPGGAGNASPAPKDEGDTESPVIARRRVRFVLDKSVVAETNGVPMHPGKR